MTTDALRERAAAAAACYVLHEDATAPLAGTEPPPGGEVLLVVGPEGGIAPEELAALESAGAVPVRLGRACCGPRPRVRPGSPCRARGRWR